MMGFDSNYVYAGWDLPRLPIPTSGRIEEEYRRQGPQQGCRVPVIEFRRECRAFRAALGSTVQRAEFKAARRRGRLGAVPIPTNWTFAAEAQIAREL